MRRHLIICLLLFVATSAVFGQVLHFKFVRFDDYQKVKENLHVTGGLTLDGIHWAFTSPQYTHHWSPPTWLSIQFDCQIFGLNAGGHHLTNLLLHLVNTLLLYAVLFAMTRRAGPSVFVAALFGLHPLHVEPVAWVTGRAWLLCTLFMLLSMWAYTNYARRGGWFRYGGTLLFFTLALIIKPLFVVFPLVLLLLDYWPLDRMRIGQAKPRSVAHAATGRPFMRLVVEKLPLAAVSAVLAVATLSLERARRESEYLDRLDLSWRVANAVVSYVRYMGKMIVPTDLSILYPHPFLAGGERLQQWQVTGAAAVLILVTALVFRFANLRYLLVGWLWYLLMLLPVIGLIQVGDQAIADRYTYVSFIGLFVLIAWGGADLEVHWPRFKPILVRAAVAVVLACAVGSFWQTRAWSDSEKLLTRSLRTTPSSAPIHYNLGREYVAQKRYDDAVRHYRRAIEINPKLHQAHNNLAAVFDGMGRYDEAIVHLRTTVALKPDHTVALVNLTRILVTHPDPARRDSAEAVQLAQRAAELSEYQNRPVLEMLVIALFNNGQYDRAAVLADQVRALPADDRDPNHRDVEHYRKVEQALPSLPKPAPSRPSD